MWRWIVATLAVLLLGVHVTANATRLCYAELRSFTDDELTAIFFKQLQQNLDSRWAYGHDRSVTLDETGALPAEEARKYLLAQEAEQRGYLKRLRENWPECCGIQSAIQEGLGRSDVLQVLGGLLIANNSYVSIDYSERDSNGEPTFDASWAYIDACGTILPSEFD